MPLWGRLAYGQGRSVYSWEGHEASPLTFPCLVWDDKISSMEELPDSQLIRKVPKRRSGFALRVLLDQYNSMLGWTQRELAYAMGKDTSWLSKIFTGKAKPFDSTLAEIADAYQRAGLTGVTVQTLADARDRGDEPGDGSDIPTPWKRLVMHVLALPPEVQDMLFNQFSVMITNVAAILNRQNTRQASISSIDDNPQE